MIGDIHKLLLLPHIQVHNANALSSPFTIGFPAMTAWLGFSHALQRKLIADGFVDFEAEATAVISHDCQLQTHKGVDDFVHSIIGTGNPLDKTGQRSAFIEEARCHLNVSLIIRFNGVSKDQETELLERITHHLNKNLKVAGGDILGFDAPEPLRITEGEDTDLRRLTRKLMPGYVIIERRELMQDAMQQGQDAIDALLDYLAIHHSCEQDDAGNVSWTSKRQTAGWIVPIATGFHGITELGQAKNQRDLDTVHRFAESIVTLGEFKMPYQIHSLDEILWRYQVDSEKNLYLCQQTNHS
ncbi:MAG: type I-F CRISPR-associated protein Csy2 [Gammaproteobacteria bacterium]|nr:type I-F CRISPR-associated protein Csy2 [Gammaproteobacteria bacterium]